MTVEIIEHEQPKATATHGGFDGASRIDRSLATWSPPIQSADSAILRAKDTLDARSIDLDANDGYIHNGVQTYRDSIVGGLYRLNAKPMFEAFRVKELDDVWAEEFQNFVELQFTAWAESPECWVDASRKNTLTDLVRLAVGLSVTVGESVSTAEWLRDSLRPYKTAIQMIDPARLSNPEGRCDDQYLRKGVHIDKFGAAHAYSFRESFQNDPMYTFGAWRWRTVNARKPWGRKMVLHYFEQQRVAQSRGIGDLVSVLKECRMTKKYSDVVLQNAVLNASFAAVLESDLPPLEAFETIGGTPADAVATWSAKYLQQVAAYTGESPNMHIDGVRIPHAYPGTKLKLQNVGQPGGVGTGFEESLLRHIAAGLGLSYEEFSRDFTKTNYSSARAAMGQTHKLMQGRKKTAADGFATDVYRLWFEEALNAGVFKDVLPRNAPNFYEGMNKDFYTACTWIGAPRGQIDELKETQAALQRVAGNLSTLEVECARFGSDWREVLRQRKREQKLIDALGLLPTMVPGGGGTMDAGGGAADEAPKGTKQKQPKPSSGEDSDAEDD